MRFRKKPVEVEAWRWDGETTRAFRPFWLQGTDVLASGNQLFIDTLEGTMKASPGDWIIRGVNQEIYPCKPDIFEATYEPATNEPEKPETLIATFVKGLNAKLAYERAVLLAENKRLRNMLSTVDPNIIHPGSADAPGPSPEEGT